MSHTIAVQPRSGGFNKEFLRSNYLTITKITTINLYVNSRIELRDIDFSFNSLDRGIFINKSNF